MSTLAVTCKVTCDAFHIHSGVVGSTRLRLDRCGASGVGVTMKDSTSTTAQSLGDLREVQKANGGVVGDASYDNGENSSSVVLLIMIIT